MSRMGIVCSSIVLTAAIAAAASNADTCAAQLAKDSRAIYDATAPDVQPGADLRALLTSKTRGLVEAGAIPRATARASARAAYPCLTLKQQGQ